jgi:hypothetical protein
MRKRAAKRQVDRRTDVEVVLDDSVSTLRDSVAFLKQEITDIRNGRGGDSQHDDASRVAFIAEKVGRIADSVRKVEAARRRRDEELDLPRVVAWLRQQTDEDRARVIREMHSAGKGGRSVLA